jgi:hypothetical protein
MYRKVNTLLFKNLVETEFLLLSNRLDHNERKFNFGLALNSLDGKISLSLDVFELVKTLKQLIRILQFLNKQTDKQLNICSSTKYVSSFLELYKKNHITTSFIKIESNSSKVKNYSKGVQCFMLLEEPLDNKTSVLRKLIEENIFIVSKINARVELSSNGTYKVYNDLLNFKKLTFLIALVHIILKK